MKPIAIPTQSIASLGVFALTALRALLAPCVIILAVLRAPGWAFTACLTIAFLSDIYDGVLARHFGVATAALRRFDSATDTVFYVAVTCAAWLLYPDVIRSNMVGILMIAAMGIVRTVYDLKKFRRRASYHMWSAKVWGIALFAAFLALLGFGNPSLVPLAIAAAMVAQVEGLAASIILLEWMHDLPSVFHAWSIRKRSPCPAR
jgi:CDP-diacylglycerol--glycerol-3-phosphate 3-phosphatidyltransferase